MSLVKCSYFMHVLVEVHSDKSGNVKTVIDDYYPTSIIKGSIDDWKMDSYEYLAELNELDRFKDAGGRLFAKIEMCNFNNGTGRGKLARSNRQGYYVSEPKKCQESIADDLFVVELIDEAVEWAINEKEAF